MVRMGYKMTELGEIPGHWNLKDLGEVCHSRNEKYNPVGNPRREYIALEHIEQATGRILDIGNSEDTTSLKSVFKKGDILFGKLRPYLKKYWLAEFDGVCATEIIPICSKEGNDRRYIFYMIQQDSFIASLVQSSFGTKMPRTSWEEMCQTTFAIPPLPEQKKIADVLSTLDEKIDQTEQLMAKTKELKKGLMQRLLSKGIGHTEFKVTQVGKTPAEWEVKLLSEVVNINPSYKMEKNKEYDYIDMASLPTEGYVIYHHEKRVFGAFSGSKFKNGDVLFAKITPCTENGKLGLVDRLSTNYGVGSTEFIVLSPTKAIIKKYLFYFSKWDKVRSYAISRMVGTTGRQRIPNEVFKQELLIAIPPLIEQQKIADILSSVDDQITHYESEKQSLQKLKQGLMQKLLTGKIRVTA